MTTPDAWADVLADVDWPGADQEDDPDQVRDEAEARDRRLAEKRDLAWESDAGVYPFVLFEEL